MTVQINIIGENGMDARAQMVLLLGLGAANPQTAAAEERTEYDPDMYTAMAAGFRADAKAAAATAAEPGPENAPDPTRERGKAGAGRTRRTKAEIAEDDAADKADAALRAAGEATGAIVADRQISASPEDRVNPEDSPEDAAQDAADEAAETAATSTGKLTLDDVRKFSGIYVTKFGMGAAVEDTPTILGCKLIEVPDTQEALAEAVAKFKQAIELNPLGRAVTGGTPTAKAIATATKADVIAALMDYALKYDGQNTDQSNMPNTMIDGPKCLAMRFGAGVSMASQIPVSPENYAQAVADIRSMIENNPFGRAVA